VAWGRVAGIVVVAVVAVIGSTFVPGLPLAVRPLLALLLVGGLVLEGTLPAWLATVARRRSEGDA